MYSLVVHTDAEDDLEELWQTAEDVAAAISVLLDEIQGSQDLLDALTDHNFGENQSADFHVSKVSKFWDAGKDIWRIKFWDLEQRGLRYRVIYAYERGKKRYYVLGILPRATAYDSNDPRIRRILRAYEDLIG